MGKSWAELVRLARGGAGPPPLKAIKSRSLPEFEKDSVSDFQVGGIQGGAEAQQVISS
jgi:hypothetical protein